MSSFRPNSQRVWSSLLFPATSKSFWMQNSSQVQGVRSCSTLEKWTPVCPFSPLFLGQGDHPRLPRGRALPQSGPGPWVRESERSVRAGETRSGLFHACPRCARAATRGRQRDRSGPPRSPAPRRAARTHRGRAQKPHLPPTGRWVREAAGSFRFLKCRQSPGERWPALLAAPKTRASSEAGMAGRGGRRRNPLRRRRG